MSVQHPSVLHPSVQRPSVQYPSVQHPASSANAPHPAPSEDDPRLIRPAVYAPRRRRWPALLAATAVGAVVAAMYVSGQYDGRSLGTRLDDTVTAAGSTVDRGVSDLRGAATGAAAGTAGAAERALRTSLHSASRLKPRRSVAPGFFYLVAGHRLPITDHRSAIPITAAAAPPSGCLLAVPRPGRRPTRPHVRGPSHQGQGLQGGQHLHGC